ncbi:MAG TPA: DPP IV N-terminal domain-containing protein [Vicinamibacterales bacterium]|nr:DPP IV N-terminal domain-containing protein [Vicinamibacterales bacterium]
MIRKSRLLLLVTMALVAPTFLANPWSAGTLGAQQAPRQAPQAAALPAAPADAPARPSDGTIPVRGEANWQLAARFAPYKLSQLTKSLSVQPRWVQGGDRFWYRHETAAGANFMLVDPNAGSKQPIFDNDRIAAELTRITKDPYDGQHLPISSIRFIGPDTIQFDVTSSQDAPPDPVENDMREERQREERQQQARAAQPKKLVHHFEYTISTQSLRELADYEEPDSHPGWAAVSPDKQWVVFGRDYNLFMISYADYQKILDARRGKSGDEAETAERAVTVTEIKLTGDGAKDYGYVGDASGQTDAERVKNKDDRQRPAISWSHDAKYFSLVRMDRRKVGELWVVHAVGNTRPELETYKYDMPGEADVTQRELVVFDMAARSMKTLDAASAWKDQTMGVFNAPRFNYPDSTEPAITTWLSPDSSELYFWRRSRNQHRVDVARVNPATGQVTVVIEERLNTYVEHQNPERLANGDLIWWSERDGWAHLYRFGPDGTEKGRLTEGPWAVRRLVGVDEQAGLAFFIGNAREAGEDPYYQHLYRVGLDGRDLRLLSPGNFDHLVAAGESVRYFVDNFSRVDTAPSAVVIDREGEVRVTLEDADLSLLMAAGYKYPEPFGVKAADGTTDLHGVIYRPFDFDPAKKYPIIAYVYPGPQTESVQKSFATNATEVALAQLGFIVVTVGNRGGHPARSKWYHNYGYGDLRDYGLADKKAAIEQLADRHAWIDVDRVGIYGHSGGGFMSTAAMLVYPEFFKVAVSSAGNHNNDVYNLNWSEKHDGVKEIVDKDGKVTFEYDIETNSELAANLKGKLLLTTGDTDNNVHHAGTFRMAEALIRANKRFDFFVFPGQRHGFGNMNNYWFWLRAEYFAEHLLGARRTDVDVAELNNERPRAGGRGVTRRTTTTTTTGGRGGGR